MKILTPVIMGLVIALPPMALPLDAQADDPPPQYVDVPPPPPVNIDPTDNGELDEDLQPEVTIIDKDDGRYEEYRVNGKLYMVKVTPNVGPPYFYLDRDGDGLMETRKSGRTAQPHVPQWVIFSW